MSGDENSLSKTTLLRYQNEGIKERKNGNVTNSAIDIIERNTTAHKRATALETKTSK